MLDRVEEDDSDCATESSPFWATAWDSAFAVAETLAGQDWADAQLLDLGCGVGLTGAAAVARGASVKMVDAAPPALLFARLNTWPWRNRVRVRRLDWRSGRIGQRFDCILGADILYDRAEWPHLERFWREHLTPGGHVLLGEPGRAMADAVPRWLRARRWSVTCQEVRVSTKRRPIRIFRTQPDG
jgi:predicted nicotinamide N-methyase